MIDTKSLRVGNIVNQTNICYTNGYYPVIVDSVCDYGINVEPSFEVSLDWDREDNLEGIELTHELLLSNFFESEKGIFQHSELNFFLTHGFEFWIGQYNEIDKQFPIKTLKFIHELQNLTFELFNQELPFSVPEGKINKTESKDMIRGIFASFGH